MRSKVVAKLLLCVGFSLTSASSQADVLVAFRSQATVDQSIVTLGDIAEIRSTDSDHQRKLAMLIIGPSPGADRKTTFAFETIRSRLLAAGVSLSEVEFSGPTSITVSGAAEPSLAVTPDSSPKTASTATRDRSQAAVEAAIRRYLTTRTGNGSFSVAAKVGHDSSAILTGAGSRGFEVTGGTPPWTGSQTFTLRFIDERDQIQSVEVACDVAARPSVLAAKHSLPRGHVMRADDLVWKKAENDAEATCLADPAEVLGMETQQPLRTGQAIARSALKALPLVRNGQFVTVTSRRPGLAVQRVMKTKSDGAAGEVIPVLTLEDRKTVLARVTGLQEAEVVDGPTSPRLDSQPPVIQDESGPILPASLEIDTALLAEQRTHEEEPRIHVNPSQVLSVPKTNEGDLRR